jgi:hypothetical protein
MIPSISSLDPMNAMQHRPRRRSPALARQPKSAHRRPVPPNQSLLRSGGQWYLVCESLAGLDKVPMLGLGEPPGAELSR